VLSAALQVPPTLLLFPLGRAQTVEPLPDTTTPTWDAVRWVMGKQERPQRQELPKRQELTARDVYDYHLHYDETIVLFQLHEEQVGHALAALLASIRPQREKPADLPAEAVWYSTADHQEFFRTAVRGIWQLRRKMRKAGLIPPDLPRELVHIDDPELQPSPSMAEVSE
jgi:hypothetical protein